MPHVDCGPSHGRVFDICFVHMTFTITCEKHAESHLRLENKVGRASLPSELLVHTTSYGH